MNDVDTFRSHSSVRKKIYQENWDFICFVRGGSMEAVLYCIDSVQKGGGILRDRDTGLQLRQQ